MTERECVEILLDSSRPIDQKAEAFSQYMSFHEAVGRNMGSARLGKEMAVRQLFESLPKDKQTVRQTLIDVLGELVEYGEMRRTERQAGARHIVEKLRSLQPGTPIRVRNEDREERARFVEAKRARFVCEYSDGRRCSVPARFFLGVSKSTLPKALSSAQREQRVLVRALSGRNSNFAREKILKQGVKIVPVLLDELAATFSRIEKAPRGFSHGVFAQTLGLVRKVNSNDRALTKRIPEVVEHIAWGRNKKTVKKLIEKHPHKKVRQYCLWRLDAR